ncbi:MAG: polysaccharide biosynthesis tyrosine autokinase [Rhodobacteraceae bacterium]|nr:polysaccharide biosynthesis tyrosine autokinase [Paracoccaceae bacterium]
MQDMTAFRDAKMVAAPDVEDGEIDLLALIRTLWRGKLYILTSMLLAVLLALTVVQVAIVPMFRAEATLAIEARESQVIDVESVLSGVSSDTFSLNTEIEVIQSRTLIERLVNQMNLTEDPEFNSALRPEPRISLDKTVDRARGLLGIPVPPVEVDTPQMVLNRTIAAVTDAFTATLQRNTYVFSLSATTWSREKSVQMVNALSQIYIDDQIRVKFEATEDAAAWLSERVVDLEVELQDREAALQDLQVSSDFVSVETLDALNLQLQDARLRSTQSTSDQERLTVEAAALKAAVSTGDMQTMVDTIGDPNLRRILNQTGAENASQPGSAFMRRFEQLQARVQTDLARAQAEQDAADATITRLSETFDVQSSKLAQFQQMQRDLEATSILYETFLTRLKETSVQQGIQTADARVLSAAASAAQVQPRTSRTLALAIVLGLMIGAGGVLLYEMTRRGFRIPEELEQASNLPVFGQVPQIPIRNRGDLIGYLNDKPTSAAAEAVRNLRTSILLSNVDNPPKVIMSTSSVPGEGKTTQAISLAHNLGSLGKKVFLLEGDVRRRTFYNYFEKSPVAGLASVISGSARLEDAMFFSERLGVDVMVGQKTKINAADLFASERFKAFIDHLRANYDYVVIDTPPVLVVPDARVIGQHADAIMFTVAWDRTSQAQVADSMRELASVNLRPTGMVLSQIDPKKISRYGYGGRYGAYSRYGRSYYEN